MSGADIEADLVFAEPGGVVLRGDLYRPSGASSCPVVIAVPGGGWVRGDKALFAHWGRHLAAAGVAVFAIDYRRATGPGGVFPKNVQDVTAAARFLTDNAQRLGLDASRLGLVGASAGAHLAALAALAQDEVDGQPAITFKAMVAVYGVYDLVAHWQADLDKNAAPGDDPCERLLGKTPYDDQQLYFDASPIRHVSYARNGLKTLLIWGLEDQEVSPRQSEAFARALRQARFFVRTIAVPGAGHFWFNDQALDAPHSQAGQVAPAVTAFLRQHLG